MKTTDDLSTLREAVHGWRRAGEPIAFVPTMGNLHAGHFSLIELAKQHAPHVVASVFVNPTQFGPHEDFGLYPRTPDDDARGLRAAGCELLWMPNVQTMYPYGPQHAVLMHVPGVTDTLEGAHRPGHFDGVATVVTRLFLQVQPDFAVFGRKDYQQLAVIRQMVRDLSFPIRILDAPTKREADGLAMSSRNQYLSADERRTAPIIHQTLETMRDAILAGQAVSSVEAEADARLRSSGLVPDYAVVRTPAFRELADASASDPARVALIAARLGRTRLIDNLEFSAR